MNSHQIIAEIATDAGAFVYVLAALAIIAMSVIAFFVPWMILRILQIQKRQLAVLEAMSRMPSGGVVPRAQHHAPVPVRPR